VSAVFVFYSHGALRALHSFPTRRSSDLVGLRGTRRGGALPLRPLHLVVRREPPRPRRVGDDRRARCAHDEAGARHARLTRDVPRSEEHTSELQSLAYLVCRLLLEKKKSY